MDRQTRFLLASKLTQFRDIVGAEQAFTQARENSHDAIPDQVITDAWRAYHDGIKHTLGVWVKHVSHAGIRKRCHATNNRIERLNSTIRERTKVQRGWKTLSTPLAEGIRIHYNFVKPHMTLDGQTPAQRAGINVLQTDNKWLEMLLASQKKSTT